MSSKTVILQYLNEAHALETALVTNLRAHIALTTDDHYRALLERHLEETRQHAKAVDRRRKALGGPGGPGLVSATIGLARDVAGQAIVLAKGPVDILRTPSSRERMLKNARDECASEALEIAAYDTLETIAKAADDRVTAKLAADHRAQEEQMLADLRAEITRLAVATFEQKSGEEAKPQVKAASTRKSGKVAA
jgi:ferritin-like metal-binding protein YciE